MREIRHVIIHCAATPDGDPHFTREWIDAEHKKRGWAMIGYHFVIHVDGSLHEGRPVSQIGAHVEGQNSSSIGVCMVGTARFTAAQWDTLRDLISSLCQQYPGVDVLGHRDYSPDLNGDGIIQPREWIKICPGFDVKTWRAAAMASDWAAAHLFVGTQVAGLS